MIGVPENPLLNMVGPVNWLSPFNSQLQCWLQAIPGLTGGSRIVNLARPDAFYGTLTNGAYWWGGIERQGGWGHIELDGTNDYIALPGGIFNSNTLTLSLWCRTDVVNVTQRIFSLYQGGFNNLEIYVDTASSRLKYGTRDSPRTSADNVIVAGEWRHLLMSLNAGSTQLYINGVASGVAGSSFVSTFTATTAIGQSQNANYLTGAVDEFCGWRRAMTAWEAKQIFLESCQNNPSRLSRLSHSVNAETAGAVSSLLLRRRRMAA